MKGVTNFEKDVATRLKGPMTKHINFAYGGRRVNSHSFHKVADAILANRIQVRWVDQNSKIPGDGLYDHTKNTFYIRNSTSDPMQLWPLVAHEAVHARSDLAGRTSDPWVEEALGFIAQCGCLRHFGYKTDDIFFVLGQYAVGAKPKRSFDKTIAELKSRVSSLTDANGHLVYDLVNKYQFDGVK